MSSERRIFYPLVVMTAALVLYPQLAKTAAPEPSDRRNEGLPHLSFGLKAGAGLSQHSGVKERDADYEVASEWKRGFAAGIFLYLPITPRFGLQQELLYVQKGSRQDITVEILDIPTVLDVTYDMDYIEIPVLMRLTWYRWSEHAVYSYAGTAFSLKIRDRYTLTGEIDDGNEIVPLYADSDLSEVEMFDYSFVYGAGMDVSLLHRKFMIEYRFVIGWNRLAMPTYAYVPFGDEEILIDNEPVPLKNQNHLVLIGITF
jgi:hypothetical protein